MDNRGDWGGDATPDTYGATASQSALSENDMIRVLRPGESIKSFRQNAEAPKLKLKLRSLVPRPAPLASDSASSATATTRVAHSQASNFTDDNLNHSGQLGPPMRWQTTAASTRSKKPKFTQAVSQGTANNPIDIETLRTTTPHKLPKYPHAYHAAVPVQYRPSRPKLISSKTKSITNSSIPDRHQSHDMCTRMGHRTAASLSSGPIRPSPQTYSATARPIVNASGSNRLVAYGEQYANASASYADAFRLNNTTTSQHPYSYQTNTASYQTPINGHPIYPKQNEDQLRNRAIQYVLDHSRPRPRKHRIADDLDATSGSEYGYEAPTRRETQTPISNINPSRASTPSTGASEENMWDRNLRLAEMVEHTQLLTGLLMAYPYSKDQYALRSDIKMLGKVSEKRLETWLAAEHDIDLDTRKRRRVSSAATTPCPPSPKLGHGMTRRRNKSEMIVLTEDMVREQREKERLEAERRKREYEIKNYLSAESGLWEKAAVTCDAMDVEVTGTEHASVDRGEDDLKLTGEGIR